MKITFGTNLEKEREIIKDMFSDDILGVEHRAKQYGFPLDFAMQIHEGKVSDENLDTFLAKEYSDKDTEIKNSIKFFEEYWEKETPVFAEKFSQILGEDIPNYRVDVARYLMGISDWYGTNIVVAYYTINHRLKEFHKWNLLFEIILSQVFQYTRKFYNQEQLEDNKIWGISELSAFMILDKEFDLKLYEEIAYPPLAKIQDKAYAIYVNRKNFKLYIDEMVKLVVEAM